MKNSLIILTLLFTTIIYAQEKNCYKYKSGEFRYLKEERPEKIIRTETLQTEINPINNVIIKTSIEWTSDCSYVLTYSEILNHPQDVSSAIGKRIYCEIIETNGDQFKVHAKSDVINEVLEFIKIK
ncbi:hypothetical protein [Patiriisocius hiemis]|uniref:Uncharacterized protein n=1 Tax=Patiriisocius hiemis TaxID=3075604 RepID=A0ABU2YB56_9FLAO|nr:hypothetical protein [Constantimarinum sp. W242]MDT0555429.1 hypothetical protein [Constantimarinum sp. W242]